MSEIPDLAAPRPAIQRRLRHPQDGQPRRRLQFGTGCPHRGPAPACQQRQSTYQPRGPSGAADARNPGRLRVLNVPPDRDRVGSS